MKLIKIVGTQSGLQKNTGSLAPRRDEGIFPCAMNLPLLIVSMSSPAIGNTNVRSFFVTYFLSKFKFIFSSEAFFRNSVCSSGPST